MGPHGDHPVTDGHRVHPSSVFAPIRLHRHAAAFLALTLVASLTQAILLPGRALAADDATISGVLWDDVNGDGVRDGGEGVRPGLTVQLRDATTLALLDTTTTDPSGAYSFTVDGALLPLDLRVRALDIEVGESFSTGPDADLGPIFIKPIDQTSNTNRGVADRTVDKNDVVELDGGVRPTPTVSGRVWKDTNVNGVEDTAPPADGAAVEGPMAGVPVSLVHPTTGEVIATTTTAADGTYLLDSLPDGNWLVKIDSPDFWYEVNEAAADNDITQQPEVLGEELHGTAPVALSGSGDTAVDAVLAPRVTITTEIIPTVGIQDGTAPFNTFGTCPTLTAGDDCADDDGVVRTNDVVTFPIAVTVDNIPDVDGSGNIEDAEMIDDVVFEMTIVPSQAPDPVAIVGFDNLPAICETTGGADPVSTIVTNPDQSVTLTCNLGSFKNELKFFSASVKVYGGSDNLSSLTTTSRIYQSRDEAVPAEPLPAVETDVSASPQFNLTKNNNAVAQNRHTGPYPQSRVNPLTGETEYGYLMRYEQSIVVPDGGRGLEPVGGDITWTDDIDDRLPGGLVVECWNRPIDGNSYIPHGVNAPDGDPSTQLNQTQDNGNWSCVREADGDIQITVTDADTSGARIAQQGWRGNDLTAGPYYVITGTVGIWYPASELYDVLDDGEDNGSWDPDVDDPISGTVNVTNCVGDFEPTSEGGTPNFGGTGEPDGGTSDQAADPADRPTGDNCKVHSLVVTTSGSYWKRYYKESYSWSAGRPWLRNYPSGQATADTGDGTVFPGEKWSAAAYWYNRSLEDHTGVVICETIDQQTTKLSPFLGYLENDLDPAGNGPLVATVGFHQNGTGNYKVQYYADAGGFNIDHGHDQTPDPITGRLPIDSSAMSAGTDCSDAGTTGIWHDDPYAVPGGLDAITRLRLIPVDYDETADPVSTIGVAPGTYLALIIGLEARDTFNGGPADEDGELIPTGTLLVDHSGYRHTNGSWVQSSYNPNDHSGAGTGDRVTLTRVQVRIDKKADDAVLGDDNENAVAAGDPIKWSLWPSVTAGAENGVAENVRIVDVLPEYTAYDPSCTPAPPAGYAGPLITDNGDGTTTLEWSLGDRPANVALDPIEICTSTDPLAPNGVDVVNSVEIIADNDASNPDIRSDDRGVELQQVGGFKLGKEVDQPLDFEDDQQVWTLTWANFSAVIPIDVPYIYELFPYNGDGPGDLSTKPITSNFTGHYELTAEPTADVAGAFEYTADDPETVSFIHQHPSNDPTTGTTTWCSYDGATFAVVQGPGSCPTDLGDSTGFRFVSDDPLPPSGVANIEFTMDAGDSAGTGDPVNDAGDRYANRFAAYSPSFPTQEIRSNTTVVQVVAFTLGDLVFADANDNGVFDGADRTAPAGVDVELWDVSGAPVLVDTVQTNDDGRYVFVDIGGGDLEVRIPATEFQGGGPLENWVVTTAPEADPNTDENEDVDHHAQTSGTEATTGIASGTVTLSAIANPNPSGGEPLFDDVYPFSIPFFGDAFTNYTVDFGLAGPPAIEIVKDICTAADLADCDPEDDDVWDQTTEIGWYTDAIWRITVTNTGWQNLSSVVIDDDLENDCDAASTSGALPSSPEGQVVNELGVLTLDETVRYTCTSTNVLAEFTNTAAVDAISANGTEVDDADDAEVTLPPPAPGIDVEKATNTIDADDPTGPYLPTGDPVTWTYVVTNTGNMPLSDVTVVDDNGTPGDAGDDLTGTYVSGDDDGDDLLDLDETWTFTATGTATSGQYANDAEATGSPVLTSLDDVTDNDASHHFGLDAVSAIRLEKATNGVDADTAPGPYVAEGGNVEWTYVVTTDGSNVPLSDIEVIDDNGTPGDTDDDLTAVYLAGDDDGDDILDGDETWTFRITGLATAGQYRNEASVTGTTPTTTAANGNETPGVELTDDDPSHYYGVTTGITIEKSTNGTDADTAPGVYVDNGGDVTWTYLITNTGNTPLGAVTVLDDQIADDATEIDCGNGTNVAALSLAAGAQLTCTATGTATPGAYVNTGSVTGNPLELDGDDLTGFDDVTDDDPSNHYGVTTGVTIEKSTNGVDADTAPGPYIEVGDTVTWTYEVTNTGNTPLGAVTVLDDQIADDATIDCGTRADDTDADNVIVTLGAGASVTCSVSATAVAGAYVNTGSVTGNPLDLDGDDLPGADDVTDDDPSNHYGVQTGLDIEKSTQTFDADTGVDPLVAVGDDVRWVYTVTNTGNVDLENVTVTDDQIADDTTIDCGTRPDDTEGDNVIVLLEAGDSVDCRADGVATAGAYTNVGSATGNPLDLDGDDLPDVDDPTDDDTSNHYGVVVGIDIEKSTQTLFDADTETGPTIATSEAVLWTYEVTNTGNVGLSSVDVTDDQIADDTTIDCGTRPDDTTADNDIVLIAPGETITCTATGTAIVGQYENEGTATGSGPTTYDVDGNAVDPEVVTDSDLSHYWGANPVIGLEKATNGVDADDDPVLLLDDSPITWTYTVTNTGQASLTDVELVDDAGTPADDGDDWTLTAADLVSGDDDDDDELDPGETWILTATGVASELVYENTAVVTGTGPDTTITTGVIETGPTYTDGDPSGYTIVSPSVTVAKFVNGVDANDAPGPEIAVGTLAEWTYVVTNTGDVPLIGIQVTDDQGVAVTCPVDRLAPGEDTTCTGSAEVVDGDYVNIGTVSGQPATGDPADPDGWTAIVDPITDEPIDRVSDDDPAHHHGFSPSFEVSKQICSTPDIDDCDPDDDDLWLDEGPVMSTEPLVWRVTVTNDGTIGLADVTIVDADAPGCSTVVDTLAPGESTVVTCQQPAPSALPVTNSVTVGVTVDCPECPPDCPECELPEISDESTAVDPPSFDLDKQVDDDTPIVGQIVEFTVTAINIGGYVAEEAIFEDQLPPSLEFVEFEGEPTATVDTSTGLITWEIPELQPGDEAVIVYRTKVVSAGTTENIVTQRNLTTFVLGNNAAQATEGLEAVAPPATLAFTGSTLSWTIGLALALLTAGVAFLLIGGRRRNRSTD